MKIAIASHITLDSIDNEDNYYLGGPACYCGLTCRQLGFETILVTKVGEDLPEDKRDFLNRALKHFFRCIYFALVVIYNSQVIVSYSYG